MSSSVEAQQEVSRAPWLVVGAAGAVAVGWRVKQTLNQEIDPSIQAASLLPYCHDIAEMLEGKDYAVVGGLPIDAFNHPGSEIDAEARTITVSADFDTKLIRDNGTVRDFDILMLPRGESGKFKAAHKSEIRQLKEALKAQAKQRADASGQLTPTISVFSFDDKPSLFHTATMLEDNGNVVLRQGFTEQVLPDGAMETWQMITPDGANIKVLNPWEQYWRSMVRFSSGMKPKDADKLGKMLNRLRTAPGLSEMENGELCTAYSDYHDAMLENNSFTALTDELVSPDHTWQRAGRLGLLTTARTVLEVGSKFSAAQRVVQSNPKIFDHFVGGR